MNLQGKVKGKWYDVEREMKGNVTNIIRKIRTWEENDKEMKGKSWEYERNMIRKWEETERKCKENERNCKENDKKVKGNHKIMNGRWYEVDREMKGLVRKMIRKWEEHDKKVSRTW